MRASLILGVLAFTILVANVTSSRSQSSDTPTPEAEPIADTPSTPLSGPNPTPKNPFEPYDPGPQSELWTYQQLNQAERQIVDHGRTDDYAAVNAGYAGAVKQLSDQANAEAAETQLGADNLETTGVVP